MSALFRRTLTERRHGTRFQISASASSVKYTDKAKGAVGWRDLNLIRDIHVRGSRRVSTNDVVRSALGSFYINAEPAPGPSWPLRPSLNSLQKYQALVGNASRRQPSPRGMKHHGAFVPRSNCVCTYFEKLKGPGRCRNSRVALSFTLNGLSSRISIVLENN